jgi:hypothetical protein
MLFQNQSNLLLVDMRGDLNPTKNKKGFSVPKASLHFCNEQLLRGSSVSCSRVSRCCFGRSLSSGAIGSFGRLSLTTTASNEGKRETAHHQ